MSNKNLLTEQSSQKSEFWSQLREKSQETFIKFRRIFSNSTSEFLPLPYDLNLEDILSRSFTIDREGNKIVTIPADRESKSYRTVILKESKGLYEDEIPSSFVEEYVFSSIYDYFSIPHADVIAMENGKYLISQYIPGKDASEIPKNSKDFEIVRSQIKQRFVLDLLLGSLVESDEDLQNLRLGSDNNLYRVKFNISKKHCFYRHNYGSIFVDRYHRYYSMIDLDEMRSYRDSNPYYQDLSDLEIFEQLDEILKLKEEMSDFLSFIERDLGIKIYKIELDLGQKLISLRENLLKTNKSIQEKYCSEFLKRYLVEFDKLELLGNPKLKDTVRENIICAEFRDRDIYEKTAKDMNMTVDELKQMLQELVTEAGEMSYLFRATSINALSKVLETGRFKSLFETQTSHGTYDPDFRSDWEEHLFGFPSYLIDSAMHSERPIYGYFSELPDGMYINKDGEKYQPCTSYGEITVRLKDEVKKKSTISFQDTLGNNNFPTPALLPYFTSLSQTNLTSLVPSHIWLYSYGYNEVQFHNQLLATDIEEIIVTAEIYNKIKKFIDDYNLLHPENTLKVVIRQ